MMSSIGQRTILVLLVVGLVFSAWPAATVVAEEEDPWWCITVYPSPCDDPPADPAPEACDAIWVFMGAASPVVGGSVSGQGCKVSIGLTNERHFWTNYTTRATGNASATASGELKHLYNEYRLLPPRDDWSPLAGLRFDAQFSQVGDSLTFLTNPEQSAIEMSTIQFLLDIAPAARVLDLNVKDYPAVASAFEEVEQLRNIAQILFLDEQAPTLFDWSVVSYHITQMVLAGESRDALISLLSVIALNSSPLELTEEGAKEIAEEIVQRIAIVFGATSGQVALAAQVLTLLAASRPISEYHAGHSGSVVFTAQDINSLPRSPIDSRSLEEIAECARQQLGSGSTGFFSCVNDRLQIGQ